MRLNLNTFCFILVGAIVAFTLVEKALFVFKFGNAGAPKSQAALGTNTSSK